MGCFLGNNGAAPGIPEELTPEVFKVRGGPPQGGSRQLRGSVNRDKEMEHIFSDLLSKVEHT